MIRRVSKIAICSTTIFGLAAGPLFAQVVLPDPPSLEATEQSTIISHGLSTFGELKYPEDFTHFDYVNPQAPKGGSIRHSGIAAQRTFDSLNPWILKGDAAEGMSLLGQDGAASLVF